MTRLEEMRRRLDAKRASSEGQADMQACAEAYRNADMVLHAALTDDTIAALLDVAEAVDAGLGEIGDCEESWECADGCCLNIVPRHGDLYNTLGTALAPLVEEATDD